MTKSETHKKRLAKLMLDVGEVTACQIPISNANQYFDELEVMGISVSRWGKLGGSRVKWRSIPANKREKALAYIGIKNKEHARKILAFLDNQAK